VPTRAEDGYIVGFKLVDKIANWHVQSGGQIVQVSCRFTCRPEHLAKPPRTSVHSRTSRASLPHRPTAARRATTTACPAEGTGRAAHGKRHPAVLDRRPDALSGFLYGEDGSPTIRNSATLVGNAPCTSTR
jgi:hypothetical protein